jgi:hypothetical protein
MSNLNKFYILKHFFASNGACFSMNIGGYQLFRHNSIDFETSKWKFYLKTEYKSTLNFKPLNISDGNQAGKDLDLKRLGRMDGWLDEGNWGKNVNYTRFLC